MKTDQRRVVEEDWERFSSLDRLINHWQRPGWEPGKRAYYWYVTFADSPDLRQLAEHCQASIAAPYLDPIDPSELHMTLDRVGAESELDAAQLLSIEGAAERMCGSLAPFTLTVGPLAGSSGAIRFSTTPWEPLVGMRESLRGAIASSVPRAQFEEGEFKPHIGIAYCNSEMPARPVIQAVELLRTRPEVTVLVDRISLVLLERRNRAWRWTTRQSFPLTGQ